MFDKEVMIRTIVAGMMLGYTITRGAMAGDNMPSWMPIVGAVFGGLVAWGYDWNVFGIKSGNDIGESVTGEK